MQVGFSTLGTNAILVALTHRGRVVWSKKYFIVAKNSTPIMSQQRLKNRDVNPSGPGALLSGMENKAVLISSFVTGRISLGIRGVGIGLAKSIEGSSSGCGTVDVNKDWKCLTAKSPISF